MARYRIVPQIDTWSDGTVHFKYIVQKKGWFFWWDYLIKASYAGNWPREFGSIEMAKEALANQIAIETSIKPQIIEIRI